MTDETDKKKPHTYDVTLSYKNYMTGRVIAMDEDDLKSAIEEMFPHVPELHIDNIDDLGESSPDEQAMYEKAKAEEDQAKTVEEKVENGENVVPFPGNTTKH